MGGAGSSVLVGGAAGGAPRFVLVGGAEGGAEGGAARFVCWLRRDSSGKGDTGSVGRV